MLEGVRKQEMKLLWKRSMCLRYLLGKGGLLFSCCWLHYYFIIVRRYIYICMFSFG